MTKPAIDIEPTGDGVSIRLPFRDLDGARKAGWIAIGFGGFATLFMIAWITGPVSIGIGLVRQGDMFGAAIIAFGCLGLLGLLATAKIVAFGYALLRNQIRCTVYMDEKHIVNREQFGWFSHKTKLKRDSVKNLFIAPLAMSDSDDHESNRNTVNFFDSLFDGNASELSLIRTDKRKGKIIAPGYSRELLEMVATAIARELNRDKSESVLIVRDDVGAQSPETQSSVTVQQLTDDDVKQADFELPAESELTVIEEGDSKVYRIPERNLWKGSAGLFPFSVFWNGFVLMVGTGALVANPNWEWGMLGILSMFGLVGIGMLVGSIYMARQSAMVGVRDDILFIERKTIFGTKWTEFEASQISTISMARSNMEVNGTPVMNFQIKPFEGKAVSMFSHLDNQEIQWLAQQLRRSLGIKSHETHPAAVNFDPAQPIADLPSTDIRVDRETEQTIISIPPHSMPHQKLWCTVLLLGIVLPLPVVIGCVFAFGIEAMLLLFALIMTLIFSALFVGLKVTSTRQFRVTATVDRLEIQRDGFLSGKTFAVLRPDILKVHVADSGVKVNNKTMYCLRVKSKSKSFSLMTGRDEPELTYVARLICQRLTLTDAGVI